MRHGDKPDIFEKLVIGFIVLITIFIIGSAIVVAVSGKNPCAEPTAAQDVRCTGYYSHGSSTVYHHHIGGSTFVHQRSAFGSSRCFR